MHCLLGLGDFILEFHPVHQPLTTDIAQRFCIWPYYSGSPWCSHQYCISYPIHFHCWAGFWRAHESSHHDGHFFRSSSYLSTYASLYPLPSPRGYCWCLLHSCSTWQGRRCNYSWVLHRFFHCHRWRSIRTRNNHMSITHLPCFWYGSRSTSESRIWALAWACTYRLRFGIVYVHDGCR